MKMKSIALAAIVLFLCGCSSEWPQFRHNAWRTAAQLNTSPLSDPVQVPTLHQVWRFPAAAQPDLGSGFRASPVIIGGRLFIGNGNGRFYALNANTGAVIWQYPPAASPALTSQFVCNPSSIGIASSAVYAKIGGTDAVIFAAPDQSIGTHLGEGRLFALNCATGAEVWKSPVIARLTGLTWGSTTEFHENLGYSSPLVMGDKVYVGVGDHCDSPIQKGRVVAVDLATGNIAGGFTYCSTGTCADSTRGGGVWSPPAGATDVFVTTGNTHSGQPFEPAPNHGLSLLRLNATTGAVMWAFQPVPWSMDGDPDWSASPTFAPVSCGSYAVSTQKDGWTHAVNADTGARIWSFPPAAIPFTPGDGTAHGDTRYMRGGALWENVYIAMNGGLNLTIGGVSGGYHRLHAFNVCEPEANRLRWLVDVPGASGGTYSLGNPTVTRGIVYIGTDMGHVIAIADPTVAPAVGLRCANPDVPNASCVAMGYYCVPQPRILANVTVTGSMVYTEPALANGKVYVSTDNGAAGYVYMLQP